MTRFAWHSRGDASSAPGEPPVGWVACESTAQFGNAWGQCELAKGHPGMHRVEHEGRIIAAWEPTEGEPHD